MTVLSRGAWRLVSTRKHNLFGMWLYAKPDGSYLVDYMVRAEQHELNLGKWVDTDLKALATFEKLYRKECIEVATKTLGVGDAPR